MKEKKETKKYVVAKKFKLKQGGRIRAPKGAKIVDKRMKKDRRNSSSRSSKSRKKRRT